MNYNIFYTKKDKKKYLFNVDNGIEIGSILTQVKEKNKDFYKVYLPLDVDNEWQGLHQKYRDSILAKNRGRLILKTQTRPLSWDIHDTIVNNHWDIKDFPELNIPIRYPMLRKGIGYAGIELLNNIPGIEATLFLADDKEKLNKLKKLRKQGKIFSFVEYAHFGLVDFLPRFEGKFKKSIESLYRGEGYQQIKYTKHHHTETKFTTKEGHTVTCDFVRPRWILVVNGVYFAVEFELHDSSAVIGAAGKALIALAPATGVELPYKDILRDKDGYPLDKSLYLDIYSNPEYFDIEHKYSIGDCVAYKCLEGLNKLYQKVDEPLGIEQKTGIVPKTLGSNTASRIKARWELLAENEDINTENKDINDILKTAYSSNSSKELCKNPASTISILGKGFGGRCFINKPRLISQQSVMMDADAKSAYVSIMMRQPIAIGHSQKIGYQVDDDLSKCITLEKFYKKYKSELIENNYHLVITVGTGKINNPDLLELPEHLDYFFSYKPPVKWSNIAVPDDLEKPIFKLPDNTFIRTKTLQNTPFTHSEYELLMNMCTPKTRNFILKNARVIAANFYPKSKEVNNISEVLENLDKGYWYGVTVGDLIINILKERRDFYKKVTAGMKILKQANFKYQNLSEDGRKSIEKALANSGETFDELVYAAMNYSKYPLDDLNKYAGNCVFGSVQSPFFMIGNCITGNNITAQCRQFVIAMEKFLNLAGAITDGQVGDVNHVFFPLEQTINNKQLCRVDSLSARDLNQKLRVKYSPIGGYKKIVWDDNNSILFFHKNSDIPCRYSLSDATQYINKLCNEHVYNLGKNRLSTVEYLEVELKGLQESLTLHGQSNYMLYGGSHELYKKSENSLVAMRSYPKKIGGNAYNFIDSIRRNPESIPRQKPFELEYILKPNEYKIRYKTTYSKKCFVPGDGVFKVAWIREFSPSSMVYLNSEQAKTWEQEYTYLKNRYGQSYEYFFLNKDGTLNYRKMIETIDTAISKGYNSFCEFKKLGDYKKLIIDEHPYFKEYLKLKNYISNLGIINNDDIYTDWDDIDWYEKPGIDDGLYMEDVEYIDIAKTLSDEEIEAIFDEIEINI